MSTIAVSSGLKIKDTTFNKLVEKTTNNLKLAIMQSLMSEQDPVKFKLQKATATIGARQPQTVALVGDVVRKRFKSMAADRQAAAIKNLTGSATLQPAAREALVTRRLDIKSATYVMKQIDVKAEYAFINDKTVNVAFVNRIFSELSQIEWPVEGAQPIVVNKGLKLLLNEVKCLDETNPEWGGDDEIGMGGVTLDDNGNEAKISSFNVNGSMSDGDIKTYNPPRVLQTFNVSGNTYPKTYAAFLSLTEKDNGGFGDFLNELYQAIKAEVQVILTTLGAAAGAMIGTAIGGSIGTAIGGPIGTIIGVVAGAILGAIVGWLTGILRDDIFDPQVVTITIPSADSSFQNGLTSPLLQLVYEDFGGKYRVKYSWQLVR